MRVLPLVACVVTMYDEAWALRLALREPGLVQHRTGGERT